MVTYCEDWKLKRWEQVNADEAKLRIRIQIKRHVKFETSTIITPSDNFLGGTVVNYAFSGAISKKITQSSS